MKFIHISDLHFGKTLHGYSLIDNGDQQFWADRFIELVEKEKPQAVLIAGDVYDRSAPSGEAVALLDSFLTRLIAAGTEVFVVAGNHDSGQRLAFASGLLESKKLYISGVLKKELRHIRLEDEYGFVNIWLMPYIFPSYAATVLEDESIRDYDTAARKLLAAQDINTNERNIIVAHQNVLSNGARAELGGSESMIGGVGEIDYTAFDDFDYVALGHIHAAQKIGRASVRYSGSPLCYHFDECKRPEKGPVIVTMGAKGEEPSIEIRKLPELHRMREIRGDFETILREEQLSKARDEYIRVVLKPEHIPQNARDQLRAVFEAHGSKLMDCAVETEHESISVQELNSEKLKKKSMSELFTDFYLNRHGSEPNENELEIIRFVAEQTANRNLEKKPADISAEETDAIISFLLAQED